MDPFDPAVDPVDLSQLQFEPLANRPSKVRLEQLGTPLPPVPALVDWIDALPDQLAGRGLRRLRDAILSAHDAGALVAAAIGGHVIKTGCAPYLIDWIHRGILSAIALNGSAAIHDLELAIAGHTSEDVGPRLIAGSFGFARETSALFRAATQRAVADGIGLGDALGALVEAHGGPGLDASLLVAARRAGVPLTIHVAIGTDIVHMNPDLDGALLGEAALRDFRKLVQIVAHLQNGVWLNIGSAVVMPEVFLKAVAIVRNLGRSLDGLVTANLDFHQQYRGLLNVLQRPGSEGVALTGHHEILIPLLHAAVLARCAHDARQDPPHPIPARPTAALLAAAAHRVAPAD